LKPSRPTALSALTHGARRRGDQSGLGRASLEFAAAVLLCVGVATFQLGNVLWLEAGEELNAAKAWAADLLYVATFTVWLVRAVLRLVHYKKGDKIAFKPSRQALDSTDLGSAIAGLRVTALVFEICAASFMLIGSLYWMWMDKVSVVAAYILWLIGACCYLACDYIDNRVMAEVHPVSKMLPGHSQRYRAFTQAVGNFAFVISSIFLVASTVQWCSGRGQFYRSGTLFALVAGTFMIPSCVCDVHASLITKRLQYGEMPQILAAQIALDMQEPPSAGRIAEVMETLLMTESTSPRYTRKGFTPSGKRRYIIDEYADENVLDEHDE
jgi:hypothetical protein